MKRASAAVMISTLLLGACATQQPERMAMLEQAQQAVAAAEQSPAVNRHAPVALHEAQQALQLAQRLAKSDADPERVQHYAFIAERRAQIAEARARRELAQEAAAKAGEQRQAVLLQNREQQLQRAQREAQQARAEAAQLREEAQRQLAEMQPKQTERGLVLTLDEVLFNFNEATLQAGNQRQIDRLATFLKQNPDYQILIEGHTDAVGSDSYNQQLSDRRADAVRQALAQRGISPDRIRSVGLGEQFPVMTNATDQGRMVNRRVEVVIAQDQVPPSRAEAQTARGSQERERRQL